MDGRITPTAPAMGYYVEETAIDGIAHRSALPTCFAPAKRRGELLPCCQNEWISVAPTNWLV